MAPCDEAHKKVRHAKRPSPKRLKSFWARIQALTHSG